MYDARRIKKIFFVLLVALCVGLAFGLFIKDNDRRATSISVSSLKDSTYQSTQRIDELLEKGQGEIVLTAAFYEEMLDEPVVTREDMDIITGKSPFNYIEFADSRGMVASTEGRFVDLSENQCYTDGMKGNSGIDVMFDSELSGENVVIFYAPMHYEGEIIGVLLGVYLESHVQQLIHNTFFDEEARTFLCLRDGTVIASCNGGTDADNIFSAGTFVSSIGSNVEDELKAALSSGDSYEFQYKGTKGTANAYVTALTCSDWMMIQTFPSQVTSRFVSEANKAGTQLLVELVLIFLTCIIIVIVANSIQRKRLISENTDKTYVIEGVNRLFGTYTLVDLEQGSYRYLEGTKPRYSSLGRQGDYEDYRKYLLSLVSDEEERKHMGDMLTIDMLKQSMSDDNSYLRYEYLNANEKEEWDSINIICLKKVKGVATELLFSYQDVTRVKVRELQSYTALKDAYQAVESANKAKSSFLSNMSHDIRTPMNAIMGMTTIATMNMDDKDKVKDCLNKIKMSSQHLLGLINEVLDMSKIESGNLVFNEEEFNLVEVVEQITNMFLSQTQEKNQSFKVNMSDITHKEVIGDSMRLQQIFVNILGNAVKFTDEGGSITFGISEKTSGVHGYGCYEFTFEDTGIGMDESYMDFLFEPFVRADNSRTGKVEGTGLGMPIVKNIVQMMNGDIKVESKLGEGTKFTVVVYLQLSNAKHDPEEYREPEDLPETDYSGKRVLLVEDNELNTEIAEELLTHIGVEVETAANGRMAVERVTQTPENYYDLIFMDIQMPEMNGYEAVAAIRKNGREDLKTIPIVAMTADAFTDDVQRAKDVGMTGHLAKPVQLEKLYEALDKWI